MKSRQGLDRRLTVPNALSGVRLLLATSFVLLLLDGHHRVAACVILAVAGFTDYLDGIIARNFNQVTNLGKILDPTVDRVCLFAAIVAMIAYGAVPDWLAVIVLLREGLMLAGAIALYRFGVREFAVLPIGKAGTFGLMCGFPCLLFGDASGTLAATIRDIGWCITLPSLALSWLAAIEYFPRARKGVEAARNETLGAQA